MKLKRAYIEITNACNLSCPFCVQRHDQARYLDPKRFSDILKQVKPFTSYVYLHVLGEPLSHPQLEELLALCAGEEMKVQLTTNGTLLRSRKDLLRKYPPRQINVSVHAFPHARCDLEDVLRQCDALSADSYISLRLWCMREGELDEQAKQLLKQILAHYGLDAVPPGHMLAPGRFLSFDEVFKWPDLRDAPIAERGSCRGLCDMVAILSSGEVVPCCLDAYGQASLGNIWETPLQDILTSKQAEDMRRGFQEGRLVHALCQRCQYRTRFDGKRRRMR